MKKLIWFVLAVCLAMPVAAQDTADRWVPGEKAQALAALYEAFCESALKGEYGYDQTADGPSGWYCKDGSWANILKKPK